VGSTKEAVEWETALLASFLEHFAKNGPNSTKFPTKVLEKCNWTGPFKRDFEILASL
jgi:hypothetical protein